jgi:membrane protein YdbS with pleckstrin-like domain
MILRDPALKLDPRVQRLWALEWGIAATVAAVVTLAVAIPLLFAERERGALVVGLLGGLAAVGLVGAALFHPGLAYRRFGYEVNELGLYVARGRLWRTWQVVPHARVQTVDTKRGPLERRFGLVSVEVTTASAKGGTDVPGLDQGVADALVEELARRAGIEEGT